MGWFIGTVFLLREANLCSHKPRPRKRSNPHLLPQPYPPQNAQSHSTCPTSHYLTFSVSSIIHRLFVINRKYYFSWFRTLEKQTRVPGHRHALLLPFLLWIFPHIPFHDLCSQICPAPIPFQDISQWPRFTLTARRSVLWKKGRRGGVLP